MKCFFFQISRKKFLRVHTSLGCSAGVNFWRVSSPPHLNVFPLYFVLHEPTHVLFSPQEIFIGRVAVPQALPSAFRPCLSLPRSIQVSIVLLVFCLPSKRVLFFGCGCPSTDSFLFNLVVLYFLPHSIPLSTNELLVGVFCFRARN